MQKKKDKWLSIKEVLFVYLALSKIIYWVETVLAMEQSDFGGIGTAVLMRLLNRDLLLILSVIFFLLLDKFIEKKLKGGNLWKNVLLYAVGFVGMIGLTYAYMWIMSWFFVVNIPSLVTLASNLFVGYIAAMVALNVKYYFKAKEKETFKTALPAPSAEDKLAMLQVLLDDGILTQDEFDRKREKVRAV